MGQRSIDQLIKGFAMLKTRVAHIQKLPGDSVTDELLNDIQSYLDEGIDHLQSERESGDLETA